MNDKLYIGILTYNRLESLKKLVCALRTFTACPYELVVSASDTSDGTVTWCMENNIRVITSDNKGIAQGKNLLLYHFLNKTDCSQIVIMEDDCRVWEIGWEQEWRLACKAWDHVNWPISPIQEYEFGSNTPGSPIRTNWFGGTCTITSRESLEKVGYLDPRFFGYGGEHAEWTWRFYRLLKDKWGEPSTNGTNTVPCLRSHVGVEFTSTLFESTIYKKNMALMETLLKEDQTIWRDPWLDDKYKEEFIGFVEKASTTKLPDINGGAGERCPLCGCVGVPVGVREDVKLRNCCGVILAWAWNSEEEYNRWYADGDKYPHGEQAANQQKDYESRENDHIAAAFQRIQVIRSLRPGANTLTDIGSATGALVHAATCVGFDAWGIEPNAGMAEFAKKLNRRTLVGDWSTVKYFSDVFCLVDVLEHLTRPKECLRHIAQFIPKDGLLYVEMPEASCFDHHVHKLEWKHIRPRQHVCLYSDDAAQKLFGLCGYRVEFMLRPKMGKLGKIAYGLSHAPK